MGLLAGLLLTQQTACQGALHFGEQTMKLPEPKYKVIEPKPHCYVIELSDGSTIGPLDSVTKVTGIMDKPALVNWSAREAASYFKRAIEDSNYVIAPEKLEAIAKVAATAHRMKSQEAKDLGTAAHDIFHGIVEGKDVVIPYELQAPSKRFSEWYIKSGIEIVATELIVANKLLKYGGRLDAIGYRDGKWGIVDYKTSSGFYGNEYAYQVGGYADAVEAQYGIRVSWAEIARFSKKEPFDCEVRPVTNMAAAMDGFRALREALRLNKDNLLAEVTFSTVEKSKVDKAVKKAKQSVSEKIRTGQVPF